MLFQQVDVFTQVPFRGNPVAVVFDGDGLETERMQAIASWTNLSETVFVCQPGSPRADYRLRIFTPRRELPFAGHPTIGAAHAVTQHKFAGKKKARLIQECAKGLVEIRSAEERLYFALPSPAFRALEDGFERRDTNMFLLRVDPAFDPLRSDPRFEKLVRRMGPPL